MKSAATDDRFRFVGQLLVLVAALRVVSALSMPDRRGPLQGDMLFASTFLLVAHSAFYHFGARFRESKKGSVAGYIGIQVTFAAAIGLYSQSIGLALLLFVALGAQAFVLLRQNTGVKIVGAAVVLTFAISAGVWDMYRAAMISMALAGVGVVIAAVSGGWQMRRRATVSPDSDIPVESNGSNGSGLSDREIEVLRLASEGLTSKVIAERLGIVERTVKAHLASTYRKLGVETRAAATTVATQRGLI
jgi:DNA-binding CsgD family transcriptional regulator